VDGEALREILAREHVHHPARLARDEDGLRRVSRRGNGERNGHDERGSEREEASLAHGA